MEDKDIYDILIQYFKNMEKINSVLQEAIKKLREQEDRINALEIKTKNRKIKNDDEDEGILIPS